MARLLLFCIVAFSVALSAHAGPANIKGFPVRVTNTPDVNVANTPDVNVVNDETSPVSVSVVGSQERFVTEWRFVGFSNRQTTGAVMGVNNGGFQAMHEICAEEVSPDSRACFSSEAARSTMSTPRELDLRGWVLPSDHNVVYDPNGGVWRGRDSATGIFGPSRVYFQDAARDLNCGYYKTSSIVRGMVVADFGLAAVSCEDWNRVACCAPTAIQVAD